MFKRAKNSCETPPDEPQISGRRLTLPLELEDGRVPKLLENSTYVVGGLLALAIMWGFFAQIRELAVAHGAIVPSGTVKLVHHLEGGIIGNVHVKEGQIVAKGTPLVTLRPQVARSGLEQLRVREAGLNLRIERLSALLQGRPPRFGRPAKKYPALAVQQTELYKSQLDLEQKERQTIETRIRQRKAEIEALVSERRSVARQVGLKSELAATLEQLVDKQYATRSAFLEASARYEETLARDVSLKGKLHSAELALGEARSQLLEWRAKVRKTYAEERAKITGERVELRQSIERDKDRVDRLVLRAPVRGIVQHLAFHTGGEVVKPGELVAKIVPIDEEIVAEVRVRPEDIGHVRVGDTAELKISTFDPNVFGTVKGRVRTLSASTFEDEKGETYYKAIVALEKTHVGSGDLQRPILPGMVVQADIVTGAKSLVKYLLKPVYRSLNTAFTER